MTVETLYKKYGHSVLRRARQILGSDADARDVLQEVFTSLVARPEQFAQRSAPSTFLYSMTTHACLSRLRDAKNRSRLIDHHVRPWSSDVDPRSPETRAAVLAALAQLPAEVAEAAVYYHLDGMTYDEIAELLGCSPRHVGNLLERGAAQLSAKEAS